jgi:hypothetical protein
LIGLVPDQRREGFVHVHQTHRHAARYVERRRPREDGCLIAPETLKGGAPQKAAKKLTSAGLVKEIKAKSNDPVWWRDEGIRGILRAQAHGRPHPINQPARAQMKG